MMNFEMDKYINWKQICKDYKLDSGDITPYQLYTLEKIFKEFIKTNKS